MGVKMNKLTISLVGFMLVVVAFGCKEKEKVQLGHEQMGEFAPPDAYLEGEKHPFYGSENEWDRRFFTEHIKDYYKRRGQRQMLDLVEGRVKDTENYCRELLEKNPNDLESMYNLAAALAIQGKPDEAIKVVNESLEMGLPFTRYLAGPRDILKRLTESDQFKSIASSYDIQVLHGPMVGKVTDHSASFWVRTLNEDKIQVILSADEKMTNIIKSNIVQSSKNVDYTAIADVDKLAPDTKYFYQVLINGKIERTVGTLSFRTYPKEDKGAEFVVAFGGGAGYVPWHERIWDVIASCHPLAFLWMGDNVYIDVPENPNGVHYYTYYRRQSRPEFKRLVSSISNYAVWDDHDSAMDDVWLGPYTDKPAWKIPLLNNFKENWINPNFGTKEYPATWHSFNIGDVEFFMLDGRMYRTNPFMENPTMLGPAQKEWLLDELAKSTATFKVLASGVPWAYDAKPGAKDTWNGFQKERTEIFDFLADHKINGVILLSADRHRADIRKIERENGYTLYDFENSNLTNQHTAELVPGALYEYNAKNTFGTLTFDTKRKDAVVIYDVYSIDNEKLHTIELTLSQLSHREK